MNVNKVDSQRRVVISSRVRPELAAATARMADAADRTFSREVERALRSYIERSGRYSADLNPPKERRAVAYPLADDPSVAARALTGGEGDGP